MTGFKVHSVESAPQAARGALQGLQEMFGFIPNIAAVMGEAPGVLKAYLAMLEQFESGTLSPAEQQVVLLTTSFTNRCTYCVAAHSTIATLKHVPEDVIEALRRGEPLGDPRLEALRRMTAAIVENRGFVGETQVREFLDTGFTRAQLLEVVLGVAMKTLSNYMNHITETPLDEAFSAMAWAQPV